MPAQRGNTRKGKENGLKITVSTAKTASKPRSRNLSQNYATNKRLNENATDLTTQECEESGKLNTKVSNCSQSSFLIETNEVATNSTGHLLPISEKSVDETAEKNAENDLKMPSQDLNHLKTSDILNNTPCFLERSSTFEQRSNLIDICEIEMIYNKTNDDVNKVHIPCNDAICRQEDPIKQTSNILKFKDHNITEDNGELPATLANAKESCQEIQVSSCTEVEIKICTQLKSFADDADNKNINDETGTDSHLQSLSITSSSSLSNISSLNPDIHSPSEEGMPMATENKNPSADDTSTTLASKLKKRELDREISLTQMQIKKFKLSFGDHIVKENVSSQFLCNQESTENNCNEVKTNKESLDTNASANFNSKDTEAVLGNGTMTVIAREYKMNNEASVNSGEDTTLCHEDTTLTQITVITKESEDMQSTDVMSWSKNTSIQVQNKGMSEPHINLIVTEESPELISNKILVNENSINMTNGPTNDHQSCINIVTQAHAVNNTSDGTATLETAHTVNSLQVNPSDKEVIATTYTGELTNIHINQINPFKKHTPKNDTVQCKDKKNYFTDTQSFDTDRASQEKENQLYIPEFENMPCSSKFVAGEEKYLSDDLIEAEELFASEGHQTFSLTKSLATSLLKTKTVIMLDETGNSRVANSEIRNGDEKSDKSCNNFGAASSSSHIQKEMLSSHMMYRENVTKQNVLLQTGVCRSSGPRLHCMDTSQQNAAAAERFHANCVLHTDKANTDPESMTGVKEYLDCTGPLKSWEKLNVSGLDKYNDPSNSETAPREVNGKFTDKSRSKSYECVKNQTSLNIHFDATKLHENNTDVHCWIQDSPASENISCQDRRILLHPFNIDSYQNCLIADSVSTSRTSVIIPLITTVTDTSDQIESTPSLNNIIIEGENKEVVITADTLLGSAAGKPWILDKFQASVTEKQTTLARTISESTLVSVRDNPAFNTSLLQAAKTKDLDVSDAASDKAVCYTGQELRAIKTDASLDKPDLQTEKELGVIDNTQATLKQSSVDLTKDTCVSQLDQLSADDFDGDMNPCDSLDFEELDNTDLSLEHDFVLTQAKAMKELGRKKTEGESLLGAVMADLESINRQLWKMKREMEVVKRNMSQQPQLQQHLKYHSRFPASKGGFGFGHFK